MALPLTRFSRSVAAKLAALGLRAVPLGAAATLAATIALPVAAAPLGAPLSPPQITFPTAPLSTGEQFIRVFGLAQPNSLVYIFNDANGDDVRQWMENNWHDFASADGTFSLRIYLPSDTTVTNLRAVAEVGEQSSTSVNLTALTHQTGAGPVVYPDPSVLNGQPPAAPNPAAPVPDPAVQPATAVVVTSPTEPLTTGDVILKVTGTAAPGQYVQVFQDADRDGLYAFPELTFSTWAERDGNFVVEVVMEANSINDHLYIHADLGNDIMSAPQMLPTVVQDYSLPPTAEPAPPTPQPTVEEPFSPPPAPAEGLQPGYYECWYWHTRVIPEFRTELNLSAMGWIRLNDDGSYQTGLNATRPEGLTYSEEDTFGYYGYDQGANAFAFVYGWLEGATAYLEVGDTGVLNTIFPRKANQTAEGEPLIDTSDTTCSYKHA